MMRIPFRLAGFAALATFLFVLHLEGAAQNQNAVSNAAEIIKTRYTKHEFQIPMRDGVKLFTSVYVPKDTARPYPILLQRTPYNVAPYGPDNYRRSLGPSELFMNDGYIVAYQDVRGRFMSEGEFVEMRPQKDAKHGPADVDESSDTYDTIDWLVKNIPETNGRVGMIGSSYDGFTTLMGLINPHPALKAAVPQSPMVDGWMGDDWFHYGAFRQTNFDYMTGQMTARGEGKDIPREGLDDYANFLAAGSAGDFGKKYGLDQIPFQHLSVLP